MELKRFNQLTEEELNKIIKEHYKHWSQYTSYLDLKTTEAKFKNIYTNVTSLPIGYALVINNEVVGFCVLKKENLIAYPDITPWLSDVMIFKEYRNKGYGRLLIKSILEECQNLNYKILYLWTDKAPAFYEKMGFIYKMDVLKNNNEGTGKLYYINVNQN